MKKLVLVVFLLILGMATTPSFSFAAAPTADRGSRAEVRFLEGMMDHHEMALDMSNDCLKKAKTDTVRTLCQNIISAQSAEIKKMHDWLLSWYQVEYMPVSMMKNMATGSMAATPDSSIGGMQMGTMEPTAAADPTGMMGMMAGLGSLQGHDYEVAFLESMIDHHDDAVHMSQRLLPRAEHKELKDFAQKIITDQSAEIKIMEGLLTQMGSK